MEKWEITHINKNLPKLLRITDCGTLFLAELKSKDLLSDDDIETLECASQRSGATTKNKELYRILQTRDGAYGILLDAVRATNQSGVLKILFHGMKENRNFTSAPRELDNFLNQAKQTVFIWTVQDAKVIRQWIRHTIPNINFDIEDFQLDTLEDILRKSINRKQVCLVEQPMETVGDIICQSFSRDKFQLSSETLKWTALSTNLQNQLKINTVNFMGKEIQFNMLLTKMKDFDFSVENVSGVFLHELMKNQIPSLIHKKKFPTQYSYIKRHLTTQRGVSLETISKTREVFVITGFLDSEEAATMLECSFELSSIAIEKTSINAAVIILELDSHFQIICEKTDYPVHLLLYERSTQTFQSVKSHGNSRLQMSPGSIELSEDDILNNLLSKHINCLLITGLPGMGKSEMLLHLGNRILNLDSDILVEWYSFEDFIKKLAIQDENLVPELDKDTIINALVTSEETEFGKQFKQCLLSNEEISCVLMLDGFDELQQNPQQLAIKILLKIRQFRNFTTILTSRSHANFHLESELNTVAYHMKPFTEEDQQNFIVDRWKICNQTGNERLLEYARASLQSWHHNSVKYDSDIGGIPLHCHFLAELYKEKAIEYAHSKDYLLQNQLPSLAIRRITDVYAKLLDKKRENFESKHGREFRKRMDKVHLGAAIKLLTPVWHKRLEKFCEDLESIPANEIMTFGIITVHSGRFLKFVHHTLAEYILAEFLLNVLYKNILFPDAQLFSDYLVSHILLPVPETLRICKDFTIDDDNAMPCFRFYSVGLCFFLNKLLQSRKSPFPYRITSPSLNCLNEKFWDSYFGKRFVASIQNNYLEVAKLLLSSIDCRIIQLNREEASNLAILAASECSLDFFKLVICLLRKIKTPASVNALNVELTFPNGTTFKLTPLHTAVERGSFSIVNCLLNTLGFRNYVEKIPYLVHMCVYKSAIDSPHVIQKKKQIINLLEKLNDESLLEIHCYYNVSPILRNFIDVEILMHLATLEVDVNAKSPKTADEEGLTVLHKPYIYSNITAQKYHKLLMSFDKAGYNCWTASVCRNNIKFHMLEVALFTIDLTDETLEFFWQKGYSFNQVDDKGYNLISLAVQHGRSVRVIRKLVTKVTDWKKLAFNGDSILNIVVRRGDKSIIKMFVKEFGADVNEHSKTKDMFSPLLSTVLSPCFSKMMDAINVLIKLGADVNSRDGNGNSLLHHVALLPTTRPKKKKPTPEEFHQLVMHLNSMNFVHFSSNNNHKYTPLNIASRYIELYQKTVRFLVASGTNLNALDNEGVPILHQAMLGGRTQKFLQCLVKEGADSQQQYVNSTILHQSVMHGNVEAVKFFSTKLSVDTKDKNGNRPLHYSLYSKSLAELLEMMETLLILGADVNSADANGNNFLHMAPQPTLIKFEITPKEFHSLVVFLHSKAFNFKALSNRGVTVLHDAVKNIPILEQTLVFFIKHGVKVNAEDEKGKTPFMYAIEGGRSPSFLEMLVKNGAKIAQRDGEEKTCFHYAITQGNIEAVKFLVSEYNFDPNGFCCSQIPLNCSFQSTSFSNMMEMIKLLVFLGADVNILVNEFSMLNWVLLLQNEFADRIPFKLSSAEYHELVEYLYSVGFRLVRNYGIFGMTLLHLTLHYMEPLEDTISLFLDRNESLSTVDDFGDTPLMSAIERGRSLELLRFLIKNGAHLDTGDKDGNTSLHKAAYARRTDVIAMLVKEFNVNINAPNLRGYTPVFCILCAASDEAANNLHTLVQLGGNVNAQENQGNTILHLHQRKNDDKAHKLLLCHKNFEKCLGKSEFEAAPQVTSDGFDRLVKCAAKLNYDFKIKNHNGMTVLHSALLSGRSLHQNTVKFLVSRNPEILSELDQNGETPLFSAVEAGAHEELFNLLISLGGSLSVQNNLKQTLLHFTAIYGNVSAANVLCKLDPNLVVECDAKGNSPLHYALHTTSENSLKVANILIEHGGSLTALNRIKLTPHLYAIQSLVLFRMMNLPAINKLRKLIEMESQGVKLTIMSAYINLKYLLLHADLFDGNWDEFVTIANYFKFRISMPLTTKGMFGELSILQQVVEAHSFKGLKYLIDVVFKNSKKVSELALQSMVCIVPSKVRINESIITDTCETDPYICRTIFSYLKNVTGA
ncbi:unnamed protein product [Orchesella dallaii]|uniref:Ankyrin-3 n=1 Tax=Orchesella dallaii TaxID=48710 RepID=A0ABP1RW51_9HEXA